MFFGKKLSLTLALVITLITSLQGESYAVEGGGHITGTAFLQN